MIGELKSRCVRRRIFKVDDDQLLVFILGAEQRRLRGGLQAK